MYLSHHYAVDLVAGSIISITIYYMYKRFLPRLQPGKMFRWQYDYVEYGEEKEDYEGYEFAAELDRPDLPHLDSDEWTIGSSSSYSSASREPSTGMRSPVTDESSWEGDTLASHSSDTEYQKA